MKLVHDVSVETTFYYSIRGYSLIRLIRGCAAGQGVVFALSVLNRVRDFGRVCS